jgi:hypothetical protein
MHMHVDADDIQRALHGELPRDRAQLVKGHLNGCDDCAAAFAAAEREEAELYGRLAALDHAPPELDASAVFGLAEEAAAGRFGRAAWMRWAAGIVLGLGVAGVAYAAPGSPLREWIAELAGSGDPPPELPAPSAPEAAGGGGVGLAPGDRLRIELSGITAGAAVRALFTDAAELRAGGGSGQVTFTLAPGRLLVGPVGTDTIQLEIPRTAPLVEILSDGREVAVAELGALQVDGASMDGPGPFVLPLSEPSP